MLIVPRPLAVVIGAVVLLIVLGHVILLVMRLVVTWSRFSPERLERRRWRQDEVGQVTAAAGGRAGRRGASVLVAERLGVDRVRGRYGRDARVVLLLLLAAVGAVRRVHGRPRRLPSQQPALLLLLLERSRLRTLPNKLHNHRLNSDNLVRKVVETFRQHLST